MSFTRELRDPWGILLAGIAGGLTWAVGVPVIAAAGVGAAVYGVKALTGSVVNRDRFTRGVEMPVRIGSPEHRMVIRAERALTQFRDLARTAPEALAERAGRMGEEASTTLAAVRRLAGQASSLSAAGDRIDGTALAIEEKRLKTAIVNASMQQRVEIERAIASVRSQIASDQRLNEASTTLRTRLEATVIGLEGLVARMVEVLALAQTQSVVVGAQQIEALADELEGLRSGLVETEAVSRQVLSAYEPTTAIPSESTDPEGD